MDISNQETPKQQAVVFSDETLEAFTETLLQMFDEEDARRNAQQQNPLATDIKGGDDDCG